MPVFHAHDGESEGAFEARYDATGDLAFRLHDIAIESNLCERGRLDALATATAHAACYLRLDAADLEELFCEIRDELQVVAEAHAGWDAEDKIYAKHPELRPADSAAEERDRKLRDVWGLDNEPKP